MHLLSKLRSSVVQILLKTSHTSTHQVWNRHLASVTSLPKKAEVVICGSGIVGNSVAYHLIKKGITDVVIIQLQQHDSDFIGVLYAKIGAPINRLRSAQHEHVISSSFSLYKSLQEKGLDIGLCLNGGLYLAQNRETMTSIQRRKDLLTQTGGQSGKLEIEILKSEEIKSRYPLIHAEDLVGGALVHNDAVANPAKIAKALLQLASEGGAQVVSGCTFKKVLVDGDGKVEGVETDKGVINCKYFVNSAGWYSWEFGQRQNPPVRIPAHAVGRHYVKTKPVEDAIPKILPTVVDLNSYVYISKLEDDSLLVGGYEKNAKPVFHEKLTDPTELGFDWDHFAPTLDGAIHRFPILKACQTETYVSQPDSFSADGLWIIGESPEINNYYVGAATNGNALEVGGGMGKFLAHWIAKGRRSAPLLNFDILRFVDIHNCKKFLHDRASEAVSKQFEPVIPYVACFHKARNIRCSPLHATLNEFGAVNGEFTGYETPLYFNAKVPNSHGNIFPKVSHFKPDFLRFVEKEHGALTKRVGVVDDSSCGKFLVHSSGSQVVDYLQRLCCSNVDIPVGHMCATGMLNPSGGYETDCVLIRTHENRYEMLTPARLQTQTPVWMRKFLPKDGSVIIQDITSMFAVIQIIGPKSPSVVSKIANRDMKMRPMRSEVVDLSYAPRVRVFTFTNTLSMGYSLLVPCEYALHVYKEVMRAGKDYGILNVGFYAHRTLRMEQNLSFWGDEINTFVSPVEIDRTARIDLNKNFIGKDAIQLQLKEGVRKRLAYFILEPSETGYSIEHDCCPLGGEPIFRNGIFMGMVTSCMYGFTNEAMMLYVFITKPIKDSSEGDIVTKEYIRDKDAIYHIDLDGKRFKIEYSDRVRVGTTRKIETNS